MLRARLATAAVAIPLLLVVVFLSPAWFFAGFVGVAALLGLAEWAAIIFPLRRADRYALVAGGALVLVAACLGPTGPAVPAALVASVVLGFGWILFTRHDFEHALGDLGLSLLGILYVALLLPHFVWLRETADGPAWVIFVLAVAMAGDTAGYFAGRTFGRHKLAPRISPGKTVEGAVGILVGGALGGIVFAWLLLPQVSAWKTGAVALGMAALGQVGDLSESVVKRSFGVKESGWILPGHGGILDRIDSLVFPVAVLYYIRLACF